MTSAMPSALTLDWLLPLDAFAEPFRARLAAARDEAHPAPRLAALAGLAAARLGFLETVQLDTALGRCLAEAGGAAGEAAAAVVRDAGLEPVRVALLASATPEHLLPPLRVAGLRYGLAVTARAGAYGQYRRELFDPSDPANLAGFAPDVLVLSLGQRDFLGAVPLDADAAGADAAVAAAVADLRGLWARGRALGATVVQQSFLDTGAPLFGGLDAVVPGAPARLNARLNAAAADAAAAEGVLWLDIARAAARDGLGLWHDPVRWLQAKMELAPGAAGAWGELAARLVAAARGKSRKCLVLDLDNTLWGGVIGDDGLEGIVIGEGSGAGEAHLALQRHALALKARGVLLAVCSKNEESVALAAFRDHPEMALGRDDFAAFVANWTDKATNLQAIARALNIGLDALVFLDDNPVERDQVRTRLPMVAVPELPADPALYVGTLAAAGYFEAAAFTADDRARAGQYAANAARTEAAAALAAGGGDMDAFLADLAMVAEAGPVAPLTLARATQLINKTNQFNTTTRRRSEAEVAALAADPGAVTLTVRLADKFGDNGIVAVALLAPAEEGVLDLETWVMSCRVFGRQLEDETLNLMAAAARAAGAQAIRADFRPTAKNGVIRELFPRLGFAPDPDFIPPAEAPETARFRLDLAGFVPRPTRIALARAATAKASPELSPEGQPA